MVWVVRDAGAAHPSARDLFTASPLHSVQKTFCCPLVIMYVLTLQALRSFTGSKTAYDESTLLPPSSSCNHFTCSHSVIRPKHHRTYQSYTQTPSLPRLAFKPPIPTDCHNPFTLSNHHVKCSRSHRQPSAAITCTAYSSSDRPCPAQHIYHTPLSSATPPHMSTTNHR